ncbi:hypothetical protein I5M27_06055 [Adhaeribacter sp. BT258]|uniref:Uncharacterized protein n=1 Tax=Adhaeribacter terrigena TaxID=2793070 RepID=A0ABS1BZK3_9BACT|nr:hypothetical protein [Adhaeribacter terrigena]MBK0402540.1 hypothetical protein [Adhaeribacter terrigena]
MITHNFRLPGNLLLVAGILLIPVMAGFPWTALDYLVAGSVLTITVFLCELVFRKVKNKTNRIVLLGGLLALLMLFWAWAVA